MQREEHLELEEINPRENKNYITEVMNKMLEYVEDNDLSSDQQSEKNCQKLGFRCKYTLKKSIK